MSTTTEPKDLDVAQDIVIEQASRIAYLEAQNKKLVEALKHMTVEFKYDDHNLAFPNCNCQSHQNYHAARALLSEVAQ